LGGRPVFGVPVVDLVLDRWVVVVQGGAGERWRERAPAVGARALGHVAPRHVRPPAPPRIGSARLAQEGHAPPSVDSPRIYDRDVADPISRADVAHVARLARLELTEDELERF